MAWIRKSFCDLNPMVFSLLYKSIIRPSIEFAEPAWSPYHRGEIEALENIQRRCTRMVAGFWDLDHQERLSRLQLTSLEARRVRGDLIQIYKLIMGIEEIDSSLTNMLYKTAARTRIRIRRDIVKDFNPRHYFLFNRVAFWWNRLPDDVAQANNVISFKVRLDKWVKTKNFINY